jgi:resuscitation-promoting factor RpfB
MVFLGQANAAPADIKKQESIKTEPAKVAEIPKPTERPAKSEKKQQEKPKPKKVSKPKKATVKPKPKAKAAPKYQVTGNKQTWLAASGIPSSQWKYVDYIVSKESSWNPSAVNKSSGACGLGQQLPCGKWPGRWNDPVAALKAQYAYVKGRYGGYAQAYAFWVANSWY